jgi:hypothetical protein
VRNNNGHLGAALATLYKVIYASKILGHWFASEWVLSSYVLYSASFPGEPSASCPSFDAPFLFLGDRFFKNGFDSNF